MRDQRQIDAAVAFKRFRENLTGFLHLPADVHEQTLYDRLTESGTHLLSSYEQRLNRVFGDTAQG